MRPKDEVTVREYSNETVSFSVRDKQCEVKPIPKQTTHNAFKPSSRRPVLTLVPN